MVWVLAAVLATAEPTSAASRRWTVVNQDPSVDLTLVSVTPWEDNPMDFEGRPPDGSRLAPRGSQYFELKYGVHYSAVLKYRINNPGGAPSHDFVEFRITNRLDFPDSQCRFIIAPRDGKPGKVGVWFQENGASFIQEWIPDSSSGERRVLMFCATGGTRTVIIEYRPHAR
jgi:hypothetical protein